MSHYRTHEEVRDEYVQSMGSELGELYHELSDELTWLHMKWGQYRELFGKDPARIDLLNIVAPFFFGVLSRTLFEDILLHLARMTDPARSFGKDNLTVHKLPELIVDPTLRIDVELALGRVNLTCDFARQWRNRRLAHSDLLTARNPQLLPAASRQCIEDALATIRELLNRLELHYRSSEVGYEFTNEPGGAELLVYYLENGLESEEL